MTVAHLTVHLAGDASTSAAYRAPLVRTRARADCAWAGHPSARHWVQSAYVAVTSLGEISDRFAARLVSAGALAALVRLAAKLHAHRAGPWREAGAGLQTLRAKCLAVFEGRVPLVRPAL